MRHRRVQKVPGHLSSSIHFTSTSITTPESGEQCTERRSGTSSAVARRGPASSPDLECGPPLGVPWPERSQGLSEICTNSPVGARRWSLFRTLRHLLARWGLSVHSRISAPARVGRPPLLLRSYPRSSATRNRFPQAPRSHSVSGLSSRNAPCENRCDAGLLLMDLSTE